MSNALQNIQRLQSSLNQVILGQESLIERLLIVLLADGHLLVEGAPGLAKTRAIKELGKKLGFKIVCNIQYKDYSGIKRNQLSSRFAFISDDDLNTSGSFIQAVKDR